MSFIFVVVLGLGGLIAVLAFFGAQLSASAGRRAARTILNLEQQYSSLAEQAINRHILDNNNLELDLETTKAQLLRVLKPQVEALIGHINSTSLSDVRIKTKTPTFRNVAATAEALYDRRNKDKSLLREEEEERLYKTLATAIEADLSARMLRLG
ncbi:hypothetical protein [Eisenibacter elegans]|jgi:hypothetical protein|uniref:hypothetical protein n=1 Tax=Eisenibacter elegans TaxID=997 RepID=UPI000411A96C|nr:hypothetical protein [Eisenibacter elegans]